MEDIKQVLALFDNEEKWNSYIELSNMKDALVSELKTRLLNELRRIGNEKLKDSGWVFYDRFKDEIGIVPIDSDLGIGVVFEYWKRGGAYSRSSVIFSKEGINYSFLHDLIKQIRDKLPLQGPLQDYTENPHSWEPYIKRIPANVFGVSDDVTSIEQCLYRAKDHAKDLAEDIWQEVFEPFANKEVGEILKSIVEKTKC